MESLLNRYRNITVLLLVIMAQLVLLAVSAKNDQDVRFIRIWTVTAVTPVARIIEGLRGGSTGFLHNYILLHDTNQENQRLRAELDRFKMENVFLKNELNTAERAKALQVFQKHTPSKTLAATIIGTGAGTNSKVVLVDRGTVSGVMRGMAVVTPDGIVGKVIEAYPTASKVLLITDPDFAAGVVTERGQVHGTLKGQGTPQLKVDYVAFEEKVEPGEWIYTSGDDRIFPRGFRVGIVRAVRPAQPFKEIIVDPSGMQRGLQDVLILLEGVHQGIPETPGGIQPVYIASPPPGSDSTPASAAPGAPGTEADRLYTQYQSLGQEQNHVYGDNPPGAKAVDFTRLPGGPAGATGAAAGRGVPAPTAAAPAIPAGGAAPPTGSPTAPPKAPANGTPAPQPRTVPAPGGADTGRGTLVPTAAPARGAQAPAGARSTAETGRGPSTETAPPKNPPAGPSAAGPRKAPGTPANAGGNQTAPAPSGSAGQNTPSVTRPTAPPKKAPAPPTGDPAAAPAGAPPKNSPDASRPINQPAGRTPGGQPH